MSRVRRGPPRGENRTDVSHRSQVADRLQAFADEPPRRIDSVETNLPEAEPKCGAGSSMSGSSSRSVGSSRGSSDRPIWSELGTATGDHRRLPARPSTTCPQRATAWMEAVDDRRARLSSGISLSDPSRAFEGTGQTDSLRSTPTCRTCANGLGRQGGRSPRTVPRGPHGDARRERRGTSRSTTRHRTRSCQVDP